MRGATIAVLVHGKAKRGGIHDQLPAGTMEPAGSTMPFVPAGVLSQIPAGEIDARSTAVVKLDPIVVVGRVGRNFLDPHKRRRRIDRPGGHAGTTLRETLDRSRRIGVLPS